MPRFVDCFCLRPDRAGKLPRDDGLTREVDLEGKTHGAEVRRATTEVMSLK